MWGSEAISPPNVILKARSGGVCVKTSRGMTARGGKAQPTLAQQRGKPHRSSPSPPGWPLEQLSLSFLPDVCSRSSRDHQPSSSSPTTPSRHVHLSRAGRSAGTPALLPTPPGHADVFSCRLWHPMDGVGRNICSPLVTHARATLKLASWARLKPQLPGWYGFQLGSLRCSRTCHCHGDRSSLCHERAPREVFCCAQHRGGGVGGMLWVGRVPHPCGCAGLS